jgi:hypothetical protein
MVSFGRRTERCKTLVDGEERAPRSEERPQCEGNPAQLPEEALTNVEVDVKKRMRPNSQCINQIRILRNHRRNQSWRLRHVSQQMLSRYGHIRAAAKRKCGETEAAREP